MNQTSWRRSKPPLDRIGLASPPASIIPAGLLPRLLSSLLLFGGVLAGSVASPFRPNSVCMHSRVAGRPQPNTAGLVVVDSGAQPRLGLLAARRPAPNPVRPIEMMDGSIDQCVGIIHSNHHIRPLTPPTLDTPQDRQGRRKRKQSRKHASMSENWCTIESDPGASRVGACMHGACTGAVLLHRHDPSYFPSLP